MDTGRPSVLSKKQWEIICTDTWHELTNCCLHWDSNPVSLKCASHKHTCLQTYWQVRTLHEQLRSLGSCNKLSVITCYNVTCSRRHIKTILNNHTADKGFSKYTHKMALKFKQLDVWCIRWLLTLQAEAISQLPKLCVKISILRHRRMWVRSFSTRLMSVTFAEDKVLIFLILRKNAKIVQLWV